MLKSLLSLLLSLFYSKSEPAEVASQSLPNETDFTSVTLNTSQPDTFAAPYDGYLCIVVDTGGSINVWGDGLQSSNYSLNNGQSKLFVPMRKGNIIGYSISGRLIFGKFYKLVGGGYNTIEKLIRRGGAICLSNLYNSLRRSSSSTRKAKSLLLLPQRLILTRNTQQGLTAPTNGATLSQLPLTAGLELKENALRLFTLMSALTRMLCDKASIDRAVLSRVFAEYRRVPKSITCSRLAGLFLRDVSFLFPVTAPQLNLAKGGVSC